MERGILKDEIFAFELLVITHLNILGNESKNFGPGESSPPHSSEMNTGAFL